MNYRVTKVKTTHNHGWNEWCNNCTIFVDFKVVAKDLKEARELAETKKKYGWKIRSIRRMKKYERI